MGFFTFGYQAGTWTRTNVFTITLNPNTTTVPQQSEKKAPGRIGITDPSTLSTTVIKWVEPSTAIRTLGVLLAPDGNNKTQIQTTKDKAQIFVTKIKRSRLPSKTKWTALSSVLEPCILYPLWHAPSITKRWTPLTEFFQRPNVMPWD
jgi:hypothetical protein